MSDAPERIWLDWKYANTHCCAYDEPPTNEYQEAQTPYARLDTVYTRAQAEAMVAALRGLLDCPDIADSDYKDEATHEAERVARAAIAAIRAHHVNETLKSEHDREGVLTELARAGQEWDAAADLTDYEKKVAQMKKDFPNGI